MSAPPFGIRTYSKFVPKEPPPDSFFQDCNSDKLQHSIVKYQFDGGMFGHWFMLHQQSRQTDKLKGLRCAVQIDTIHCLLRGAYFIPSCLEAADKEATALKSDGANESGDVDDERGEEEFAPCRKVIIPKILMTNSVNSTRVYDNDFDYEQDLEAQSRELRRKQRQNRPKPKPQPQFPVKVFPHVREEMERKRREKEEAEKMAAMGRKGRNAQMKENARNVVKNESKKARKNRNMNNSNNATPVESSTHANTKGKKGRKKKKRRSSEESESESSEDDAGPRRWKVRVEETAVKPDDNVVEKDSGGDSKNSSENESAEQASGNGEPIIEPATVLKSNSNNTNDVNPDVGLEAAATPDAIPKVAPPSAVPPCQILLVAGDCLEAALSLQQITHLSTACLIMASSSQPGGGYRNGAGAQEENLFRRTNLLQCMDDPYGMARNTSFSYPLPEFGGIYVREAVCFRESEALGYRYYPEGPRLMSFIGVSAYSNPPLESRASKKEGEEEEPLLAPNIARKIKKKLTAIFRIARANHHRALVLSAFGCGAYGNPPRHIARLFREVMAEEGLLGAKQFSPSNGDGENKEECWLQYVVFAILDDQNAFQAHNPDGNVAGFEKEFRTPALTLMKMQDELVTLEGERQKREEERKQEKGHV